MIKCYFSLIHLITWSIDHRIICSYDQWQRQPSARGRA